MDVRVYVSLYALFVYIPFFVSCQFGLFGNRGLGTRIATQLPAIQSPGRYNPWEVPVRPWRIRRPQNPRYRARVGIPSMRRLRQMYLPTTMRPVVGLLNNNLLSRQDQLLRLFLINQFRTGLVENIDSDAIVDRHVVDAMAAQEISVMFQRPQSRPNVPNIFERRRLGSVTTTAPSVNIPPKIQPTVPFPIRTNHPFIGKPGDGQQKQNITRVSTTPLVPITHFVPRDTTIRETTTVPAAIPVTQGNSNGGGEGGGGGHNSAYWSTLRAGLADILCALCQQLGRNDCVRRYCTNDQFIVRQSATTPTV